MGGQQSNLWRLQEQAFQDQITAARQDLTSSGRQALHLEAQPCTQHAPDMTSAGGSRGIQSCESHRLPQMHCHQQTVTDARKKPRERQVTGSSLAGQQYLPPRGLTSASSVPVLPGNQARFSSCTGDDGIPQFSTSFSSGLGQPSTSLVSDNVPLTDPAAPSLNGRLPPRRRQHYSERYSADQFNEKY